MDRLNVPPFLAPILALVLLITVLGACRTGSATADPAIAPMRPLPVTAAAPVGPPAPTKTGPGAAVPQAPSRGQTPAQMRQVGPVAWTLTVLHTGEVYGDVLPCG